MSALLSPLSLGPLTLKNRVFLAPLTRGRCGRSQVPNADVAEYYAQRSTSGLMVSEGTIISKGGMGWAGAGAIYDESHIAGWKTVLDKVHENNGILFCQLWHLGRVTGSIFHGLQPVSASSIAAQGRVTDYDGSKHAYEVPRALTLEEIPGVVEEYVQAARNAREAGFDGIEIHGANGYLIDQFLQSCSNERTDEYGGSFENRFRFFRQIIEGCLTVFSPHQIGVKISPNGVFGSMGSSDNFEAYTYYAQQLNELKVGYVCVMDGLGFGFHQKCPQFTLKDLRPHYHGVVVGNIDYTQESAEAAIVSGDADAISFGRLFIPNPDLVTRFQNNWPLAPPAGHESYYTYPNYPDGDRTIGYTDFPFYQESTVVN